jgi:hypothetical protein
VMAIGGWSGRDPILTVDRFAALVAAGRVRYVLMPDGASREGDAGPGFDGRGGLAASRNGELFRWVTEHGRRVDPARWRSARAAEETDAPGPRPFGCGGSRGGFGPPGITGRPGWRDGLGRAQRLYDRRPEAPTSALTEPTNPTSPRSMAGLGPARRVVSSSP